MNEGNDWLFLSGGGEMGALMREHDWSRTPLGAPETWPQALRTAVRLLLTTQHPMFIWWGPDLIQFYNDAYRQTMGPERHPSALGQRGRECWAEIWDIIGPQIDYVMAGKGATWHEDQLVPVTRFGRREDVWWTYGYSPIDDADGVGGVLVVCKDVTHDHRMMTNLQQANRSLQDQSKHLLQLFDQAPGFMCLLRGPDHVFELANAAYQQLIGHRPEIIGQSIRDALPDIAGQGYYELLDEVFRSGRPYVGHAQRVQLRRGPDHPVEECFLDFVYQPIIDEDGSVTGIFVEGSDVTEFVRTRDRQSLLIRELHHRVRNTLATVLAIMGSTARASTSVAEFMAAIEGRISALAKTHSLLTEDEYQTVSFRELLSAELDPYDDGTGSRIVIEGPAVELPSVIAVPLGMALHELTTNAAKHGALAELGGSIHVCWSLRDAGSTLSWEWIERDGPPVRPPTRQGFGTRLLHHVLKVQTGAQVSVDYAESGLRVQVAIPLQADRPNP